MPKIEKKKPVGRPRKKVGLTTISRMAPTPRDKTKDTLLVQAKIDAPLVRAVRVAMRNNDIKVREIIAWALGEYLRIADPKTAKGILRKGVA